MQDRRAEIVRFISGLKVIPRPTCIGCVVVFPCIGYEICAIVGEAVHIKHDESFARFGLRPCVTLITRLPDCAIMKPDKDRLQDTAVRMIMR